MSDTPKISRYFNIPRFKGFETNDCGCWEYNEIVGELLCRVVCCLGSPDNCHNGTGDETCEEHCEKR